MRDKRPDQLDVSGAVSILGLLIIVGAIAISYYKIITGTIDFLGFTIVITDIIIWGGVGIYTVGVCWLGWIRDKIRQNILEHKRKLAHFYRSLLNSFTLPKGRKPH